MGRILSSASRLLVVLVFLIVAFPLQQVISAQASNCGDFPALTLQRDVPIGANYRTWALIKRESPAAKLYLRVDSGQCREFSLPSGSDWTWVSGPSEQLSTGSHTFSLSVDNGAVLVDKILVTNDTGCTPEGDGANCIEEPLDISISGIAEGETLNGKRSIFAQLVNPGIQTVSISFSFDGGSAIPSSNQQPFCLVDAGNGACGEYDLDQLGAGQHILRVAAQTAAGQQLTRTIQFTVAADETPAPPVTYPNAPVTSKGRIPYTLLGIEDGQTLSGSYNVAITAPGVSVPLNVTYKLNSDKIASTNKSPYCLVKGEGDACSSWDSSNAANGDYKFYAVVNAAGYDETWSTLSIKIDNPETVLPEAGGTVVEDQKDHKEVVIGNGKQQASGKVRVSIPKGRAKPGYAITFLVDNKEVGRAKPHDPSIILDTRKLSNGKKVLSAAITSPGGDEEILASEVTIKNNPFTSFANLSRENPLVAAGIVGALAVFIFAGVFFAKRLIGKRQFLQRHNISGAYNQEFVRPGSKQAFMYSGVAVAVFLVGAFTFVRFGSTVMAAGLGFIAEIEDGTFSQSEGFTQDMDHTQNRTFIRMFHGGGAVEEPPTHGNDGGDHNDHGGADGGDTNGGTGQGGGTQNPSPPVSGSPTANCNLPGGRGRGVQMGAQAPCIDTAALVAPGSHLSRSSIVSEPSSPMGPGQGEAGAFRQRCDFSHMNFDDSVLYPNQPGIAHLHTYFGNAGAAASSTSASLRSSGNSSCNGGTLNRSAYWVPSMIDTSTGRPVRPNDPRGPANSDLEIYYKQGYQGVGYDDIRSFPNGLQLIAGNAATATGPTSGSRMSYWCESMNSTDRNRRLEGSSIPNCGPNQVLVMYIGFPQCWDGRNLTSPNGRSHMAYGTWQSGDNRTTRGCPSSHPVGLPFVEMFVRYHTGSSGNASWRLSSDNYAGPAGYSGHADYIFAWDESVFPAVIQNCYRAQRDCQYGLGNQTAPDHVRFMSWPGSINRIWADWRPTYYN